MSASYMNKNIVVNYSTPAMFNTTTNDYGQNWKVGGNKEDEKNDKGEIPTYSEVV